MTHEALIKDLYDFDKQSKNALLIKKEHTTDFIRNGDIPLKLVGDIPLQYLNTDRLPGVPQKNILSVSKIYKPFRYDFAWDTWLRQNQTHWTHEEVPLGNDVVDWKTKLTDSERNLMTHIFRLFVQNDVLVNDAYIHQYARIFRPNELQMAFSAISNMECFDDETELLTSTGWKSVKDITESDKVAQYDINTKAITFGFPKKVMKYQHNGIMHHYKNQTTDIMVTPDHDLIARHPSTRKIDKVKSKDRLFGGNYLYPASGISSAEHEDISVIERILVAIQADGCLRGLCPSAGKWHTVDFTFHKDRKCIRLLDLLDEANIEYNVKHKEISRRVVITFNLPHDIDISTIKNFDFIDLEKTSPLKAKQFLEEIMFWDGSIDKKYGHMTYYTSRPEAAGKVQAIASLTGDTFASIGVNRSAGDVVILPTGKFHELTKDHLVVSLTQNRSEKTYPYRKEVMYNGYVYCVSVDSENVISRRNGKVAFTGNSIHEAAYAYLLDELGIPEVEYSAFLEYEEMSNKYNYTTGFRMDSLTGIALAMLVFGAFTEGLQLFASFAVLFNFPRQNKLKGMGQIVSFSVRDESLHVIFVSKIFKHFMNEFGHLIDKDRLYKKVDEVCRTIVQNEHRFSELAFEMGDVEGMTLSDLKRYIEFMADFRLKQFGLDPIFKVEENPFGDWIDQMMGGYELADFFSARSSEYTKGATQGTWDEAFA